MAKIVKDSMGKFIAVKEDGTRVPVDPSWVANSEILPKNPSALTPGQQVAQQAGLSPEGGVSPAGESGSAIVRPEQGVSFGERFTLKNVANPENVVQHLQDWGYEVKPYGNHPTKMQYAVRPKGTNGVWRPLDPEGFDWQDMTDLIGEIPGFVGATAGAIAAAPVATAAGLASGGPGALAVESAAVGLGSAAGEAVRQGTGIISGVEPKMSPGQIGIAGGAGAAVPVLSKLVAPLTRAAGRPLAYGFEKIGGGVRMAALRMMGARSIEGMDVRTADKIIMNAGRKPVANFADLAKAVQTKVQGLLKADWPEAAHMNDMLSAARDAGAKIDFNPILEGIENAAGAVERRAAGAARPIVAEGEALAAREGGGLRAGAPSMEEFQQSPLGQRMRRMDIARKGTVSESAGTSPGLKDFERRFRQDFGGQAFAGPERRAADTLPLGGKTQPIPGMFDEGAGMASGAKRTAIAGHEEAFGAPGAFGEPSAINEVLPESAARAEFRDPGLRKELLSFSSNLAKRFTDQGFRLSEVPIDFANVVKQDLQALARKGGAYAGKPIEDAFTNVMSDAAANVRSGILDGMPAEFQQQFADTMSKFESKTKLAMAVLNKVKDPAATESWLREVYGNSNSSALRYLQQLEDHFGVKLLPDVAATQAKEIIGQAGIWRLLEKHPYLGVGAVFRPESLGVGVAGLGAAPAVGRGLQAAGRGIAAGSEAAARLASRAAASPAAKAAAVKILQDNVGKSGKGIASESQASQSAVRRPRRFTKLF